MSAGAGRTEPAVRGGRLTIFAGCAPGTGKTYAMLQAALRAQAAGVDVVTGTDGGRWPETRALAEALGVSVATVNTLLVNAVKKIRKNCSGFRAELLVFLRVRRTKSAR